MQSNPTSELEWRRTCTIVRTRMIHTDPIGF